jgi:hypothetical protein
VYELALWKESMGSWLEMGGPISKQYCLPWATQYKIKYFRKKLSLENKWDIYDENRVVVLQAITKTLNPNAPNSSWFFKYEPKCKMLKKSL